MGKSNENGTSFKEQTEVHRRYSHNTCQDRSDVFNMGEVQYNNYFLDNKITLIIYSKKYLVAWQSYNVWNDHKDQFSQDHIIRISVLQEEIFTSKQSELSVIDCFAQLKILWDELNNFMPILLCSCNNPCACCALDTIKTYMKDDYILNKHYLNNEPETHQL